MTPRFYTRTLTLYLQGGDIERLFTITVRNTKLILSKEPVLRFLPL